MTEQTKAGQQESYLKPQDGGRTHSDKATGSGWKSQSLPAVTHLSQQGCTSQFSPKQFYTGYQASKHMSLWRPFWCKPPPCFSGSLSLTQNAAKEEIVSLILDCAHKSGFPNSPSLPFSFFPHPVTFLSPFLSQPHLTSPLASSNCLSLCLLSFSFSFLLIERLKKNKNDQKRVKDSLTQSAWATDLMNF